ncbi:MAG: carboxypeptidase M32 [Candidatus Heimdallarchaeota archaeon]|nr:carboxypeptidase M32 [Candidatus Heimdallarchaeota archaeon]
MKKQYDTLLKKMKELRVIEQIAQILSWDQEVMMPKGSVMQRSEQQAYVATLAHKKQTDPVIGKLLKEIKEHTDYETLSYQEKRNIYLMQRDYDRATKIPPEFVEEYTKESVISIEKWKEARTNNDYNLFKPHLEKLFELTKKYANYLNPDLPAYEVLLDLYEPGMTIEKYNKIFDPLKEATVELLEKIKQSKRKPDFSLIRRKVPIELQEKLSLELMKLFNFDMDKGRIDASAHPFTGGEYDDIRITTRYALDDFTRSLFAVMHETGHGCYEQNLPNELRYQPIGNYCSMGIHESQSRLYENIIGRSKSFWWFYLEKFKKLMGDIFSDVKYDDFILAVNAVQPSLIRVEADEVTYNLHIILRFEIERDLFEGKISIDELPEVWNKKMKETIGIDVDKISNGVIQDIHWSGGSFGYFPTYTLGNVYGAQFFAKLVQEIPDWNVGLEKGDIKSLTDWLTKNVHHKGNLYDPPELVKEVTGELPDTKYLIKHLKDKYSYLYGF